MLLPLRCSSTLLCSPGPLHWLSVGAPRRTGSGWTPGLSPRWPETVVQCWAWDWRSSGNLVGGPSPGYHGRSAWRSLLWPSTTSTKCPYPHPHPCYSMVTTSSGSLSCLRWSWYWFQGLSTFWPPRISRSNGVLWQGGDFIFKSGSP